MRAESVVLAAALIACCPSAANASCTASFSTGTIEYHALDPDGGRFSGVLEIYCSPSSLPATVQIALDGGGSGDPLHRTLRGTSGAALFYQIYLPGGTVLGDGLSKTRTFSKTVTTPRTLVPFIGRIFSRQMVPPGPYRDELTVTFGL